MINPFERNTKNRILELFTRQLGYVYYGNWEDRTHNSNVEESYLRAFLKKQKYPEILINKAVSEISFLAHTSAGDIYDRNKNFYSLLRYGVKEH